VLALTFALRLVLACNAHKDPAAADASQLQDATTPDPDGSLPSSESILINGLQWADSTGLPITAHGGGIIKVDSYYYWFGENRNTNGTFHGVACYRSTDLVRWEFRGNVLTQSSAPELASAKIERPKVVYNASTHQYVMWMHKENATDYTEAKAAVASSPTIDGNYTYHGSFNPLGNLSHDCTLFVDSDGKAYFIATTPNAHAMHIYRLSADYLSASSLVASLFADQDREAPALFKRGDYYFLITSLETGWNPNQQKYAYSKSISSGWSGLNDVGDSDCHHSQAAYVLPVVGPSKTTYLFMGDRWAKAWGDPTNTSGYVWLPLSFSNDTTMTLPWGNVVTPHPADGTVTAQSFDFTLTNANSGKVLDVPHGSTADGVQLIQYTANGDLNQGWDLQYVAETGTFNLANLKSGKLVDVPQAATADGVQLIQLTPNGGDNQRWRILDRGAGTYELVNFSSGKSMGVVNSSLDDGASVDQQTATGSASQLWKIAPR
jgi:hypothetical protein